MTVDISAGSHRCLFCFRSSQSDKGSSWCGSHHGGQGTTPKPSSCHCSRDTFIHSFTWSYYVVIPVRETDVQRTHRSLQIFFLTLPVLSLCVWPALSAVNRLRTSSGWGTTGRLFTRTNLPSLRSPSAALSPSTMSTWAILESTASLYATSTARKRLTWPWAFIRVGRSPQQMLWRWVKTANWVREWMFCTDLMLWIEIFFFFLPGINF